MGNFSQKAPANTQPATEETDASPLYGILSPGYAFGSPIYDIDDLPGLSPDISTPSTEAPFVDTPAETDPTNAALPLPNSGADEAWYPWDGRTPIALKLPSGNDVRSLWIPSNPDNVKILVSTGGVSGSTMYATRADGELVPIPPGSKQIAISSEGWFSEVRYFNVSAYIWPPFKRPASGSILDPGGKLPTNALPIGTVSYLFPQLNQLANGAMYQNVQTTTLLVLVGGVPCLCKINGTIRTAMAPAMYTLQQGDEICAYWGLNVTVINAMGGQGTSSPYNSTDCALQMYWSFDNMISNGYGVDFPALYDTFAPEWPASLKNISGGNKVFAGPSITSDGLASVGFELPPHERGYYGLNYCWLNGPAENFWAPGVSWTMFCVFSSSSDQPNTDDGNYPQNHTGDLRNIFGTTYPAMQFDGITPQPPQGFMVYVKQANAISSTCSVRAMYGSYDLRDTNYCGEHIVSTDAPHLVILRYDATPGSESMSLQVDGDTPTTCNVKITTTSNQLVFGARAVPNYWAGCIAKFGIFSGVLPIVNPLYDIYTQPMTGPLAYANPLFQYFTVTE